MSLQKIFGYIELILGILLLIAILVGAYFIIYVLPNFVSTSYELNLSEEQFVLSRYIQDSILLVGGANLILNSIGFGIIFFVLSVILIIEGILNIMGE